jgi:hypothetical protein
LCRGSDTMKFPDRVAPLSKGLTCAQLFDSQSSLPPVECEMHRHFISTVVDVLAFCGCTNGTARSTCSICGTLSSGTLRTQDSIELASSDSCAPDFSQATAFVLHPKVCADLKIMAGGDHCCPTAPDVTDAPTPCTMCGDENYALIDPQYHLPSMNGYTCGDVRDLASFFARESRVCADIVSVAPGCCKMEDRCSMCTNPASSIRFPSRPIPFKQTPSLTCIEVEYELGYLNTDQCNDFHWATSAVNLGAWCGCEEEPGWNGTCSLCGPESKIHEDYQIPSAPIGVTCKTLETWAPYIQDQEFCDSHVTDLRGECCVEIQDPTLRHKLPPLASSRDFSLGSGAYALDRDPTLLILCLITVYTVSCFLTFHADM